MLTGIPLGQIPLLCAVRSMVPVLTHQLIMPSHQLSERSFAHKESCRSSCQQVQYDGVSLFTRGCYMVELTFVRFATSQIPHGRALDTIHQALSVAGGSFSEHSDVSRSYCASHSIRIYYGWPGDPIVGFGRDNVSRYFRSDHLCRELIVSFLPSFLVNKLMMMVIIMAHGRLSGRQRRW